VPVTTLGWTDVLWLQETQRHEDSRSAFQENVIPVYS
jgi:hypothetical protein